MRSLPGIPNHPFRERLGSISRAEDADRYCARTGRGWEEPEAPPPLPRVKLSVLLVVAAVIVCGACMVRLGVVDRTVYPAPQHSAMAAE